MLNADKRLALACIFAFLTGAASAAEPAPETVSMIDLIANGEKYDGKLIQVGGFISLTWEDDALYFSKQDYAVQLTKNAIWLDIDESTEAKLKKYDQHYGYIVGTFSAKGCGHLCLYHGSIKFENIPLTYNESARTK